MAQPLTAPGPFAPASAHATPESALTSPVPGVGDVTDPGGVTAGQVTVDLWIVLHPLPGPRGDLSDYPRRDPGGEHAIGNAHPRRHGSARRDQRAAADDHPIEHRGAVAHQRLFANDGAVNDTQVTDGRSLADLGHRVA